MSKNIVPFSFEEHQVRVVSIDGEPWFVARDVATVLGYSDPTNAVKQHCKGVANHHPLQTAGGTQQVRVISEPDVLRMIVSSKLPAAEKFERWVFEEVIPEIRRTGGYGQTPALTEQEIVHQALQITVRQVKELEAKVAEDAPKVAYVERFVGQTSDAITVDVFASQFGSTGPKVRELMKEKSVAVRKFLGERWSNTEQRMKPEYEWRPRQGVESAAWFDLRPQHNAPRLHNGQVKQTMYVRQFHAQDLAQKLGLTDMAVA